jgi:hypothetical protein
MAYTLSLSNGTSLLGTSGLPDGTIDTTSTSLALVGKNYPGYGVFLNENMIHMLENFSNTSAPSAAVPGQLWYDSGNKVLKVNVVGALGSPATWKSLAGITNAANKAAITIAPNVGEFWWDTTNNQLKVYSGLLSQGDTGWVTVGPASNTTTGQSGAQPDTVVDTGSVSHVVVKFYISSDLVAILSKDAEFIPGTPINGFNVIRPGFNLSNGLTNQLQYFGNANVAMNLMVSGTVVSADKFTRSDVVTTSTVPMVTSNVGGLSIGPTSDFVVNVSTATTSVGVYNNDNNYDTIFYVKTGGLTTPVMKANGALGAVQLYNDPTTSLGVATKQYVDTGITSLTSTMLRRDGTNTITGSLTPSANVTYNLGSSTAWFNGVYGKSYQAQYADLAERFEADAHYDAGTVVEIGGTKEVTAVKDDLSDAVFGVVSTDAAYLLNSVAGTNETHPAIALAGRVPVKVIGKVTKGDRLVSAGNGIARAAQMSELTPFNVIGRALEHKVSDEQGTIQAIVKINS